MAAVVEVTHPGPALACPARRERPPDRRKGGESAPVSRFPASARLLHTVQVMSDNVNLSDMTRKKKWGGSGSFW